MKQKTNTVTLQQKSDKDKTFEELIIDNQNFVYSIVNKQFDSYPHNVKQDLFSAGKLGLVVAAQKFNPTEYSNKFISYAVHWIRYYVNEEIRKLFPVKLNQNYIYKRNKIAKLVADYQKEHEAPPTDQYICKQVGITQKVLDNIRKVNGGKNFTFVSFQAPTRDQSGSQTSRVSDFVSEQDVFGGGIDLQILEFEVMDAFKVLKSKVSQRDYNMFYDLKINGLTLSELKDKYKLNFPSSAAYIIKRTNKLFDQIYEV